MNAENARTDVSLDTVHRVLKAANINPDTLTPNDDRSFTASFKHTPAPVAEKQIQRVHPCIVLVKRDSEIAQLRRPNVEPDLPVLVHFAFNAHPDQA